MIGVVWHHATQKFSFSKLGLQSFVNLEVKSQNLASKRRMKETETVIEETIKETLKSLDSKVWSTWASAAKKNELVWSYIS